MNIGCNSLENLQLHVIEEYINGILNPKDIYCLLPKFHQQPINVFLRFGFTLLSLLDFHPCTFYLTSQDWGFLGGIVVKDPPANAGDIRDADSVLGSGRSPGGGHGNPLQFSCLETPMDRGLTICFMNIFHEFKKSILFSLLI